MKKKNLIIKFIIIILLISIFIFLYVIKNNVDYAEWYTNNISTKYISFISKITSIIPFSLYEWIFIILIILAIYFIVKIIIKLCQKQFYKSFNTFLSLLIITFIVTNIYVATASISYGKKSLYVPQYDQEVNDEFIDQTFDYFLNDYNEISTHFDRNDDGTIISPYTFEELNNILNKITANPLDTNAKNDLIEWKRIDSTNKFYNHMAMMGRLLKTSESNYEIKSQEKKAFLNQDNSIIAEILYKKLIEKANIDNNIVKNINWNLNGKTFEDKAIEIINEMNKYII